MSQSQAELEKKARELADLEKVLNKRESLLEREKALEQVQSAFKEAEAKVSVLNKQIKAKEDVLAANTFELQQMIETSSDTVDKLRTQETTVKQAIKVQEELLANLKRQDINANASIRAKKTELTDLQNQVKEAKQYCKDQEQLAQDTIATWNSDLVAFRKEADDIQHSKNKLSADIIRLEQDKTAMVIEVKKIEEKLDSLDTTYEQKVEVYKGRLRTLDVQVSDKSNELDGLNATFDMRRVELDAREKSLRLKEISVNSREHDLDQKERRLKMNYGVAGIDFDVVV